MKKLLLSILVLFASIQIFAQQDAKAKAILEKVTKTTKSYNTIKLKFLYIMDNKIEKMQDTSKGTIYIKGDMFKLFFRKNEIFSNGKTIWTHLVSANEITISEPEEGDEDALNPTKMLTIYEKGFKYRFMGEFKSKTGNFYQIDLYPKNPKQKPYSVIKLKIDKAKNRLTSVKMVGKDQIDFLIELTQFKPNVKVADAMFTFDKSKYPKNIEINDMRD